MEEEEKKKEEEKQQQEQIAIVLPMTELLTPRESKGNGQALIPYAFHSNKVAMAPWHKN